MPTKPPSIDDQLQAQVTFTIVPHDKHQHPEAQTQDIGATKGTAQNLTCNTIVAGYSLNDLRLIAPKMGALTRFSVAQPAEAGRG